MYLSLIIFFQSADLYKSLQSCEVLSLKDSFPVSQDMTVECVAARVSDRDIDG